MSAITIQRTSGSGSSARTITGYVQPNGKQVSGDGKTTWSLVLDHGDGPDFLATFSELVLESALGGFFQKSQSSCQSGHFDTVTLVFANSSMDLSVGTGDVVKTTYTPGSNMVEKPLEDHADYRTKWNYNLYGFVIEKDMQGNIITNPSTPVLPSFAATATDTSGADGKVYVWAKSQPGPTQYGHWTILQAMTKPGVESYLYPQAIVTERKYYRTEANMIAALGKRGLRKAPAKFSSLATEWLITDCRPEREDDYWLCCTEFTGADAWDHDLYEAAT